MIGNQPCPSSNPEGVTKLWRGRPKAGAGACLENSAPKRLVGSIPTPSACLSLLRKAHGKPMVARLRVPDGKRKRKLRKRGRAAIAPTC